ncbi:MAG: hypothetical protein MPI95_04290 [Nitrosopumilus sp.]|nr:hypothetical protein [Nitrosopumilus sp.]MDA7958296.1 hypothetical protein [Nitrosopumilus sp.]
MRYVAAVLLVLAAPLALAVPMHAHGADLVVAGRDAGSEVSIYLEDGRATYEARVGTGLDAVGLEGGADLAVRGYGFVISDRDGGFVAAVKNEGAGYIVTARMDIGRDVVVKRYVVGTGTGGGPALDTAEEAKRLLDEALAKLERVNRDLDGTAGKNIDLTYEEYKDQSYDRDLGKVPDIKVVAKKAPSLRVYVTVAGQVEWGHELRYNVKVTDSGRSEYLQEFASFVGEPVQGARVQSVVTDAYGKVVSRLSGTVDDEGNWEGDGHVIEDNSASHRPHVITVTATSVSDGTQLSDSATAEFYSVAEAENNSPPVAILKLNGSGVEGIPIPREAPKDVDKIEPKEADEWPKVEYYSNNCLLANLTNSAGLKPVGINEDFGIVLSGNGMDNLQCSIREGVEFKMDSGSIKFNDENDTPMRFTFNIGGIDIRNFNSSEGFKYKAGVPEIGTKLLALLLLGGSENDTLAMSRTINAASGHEVTVSAPMGYGGKKLLEKLASDEILTFNKSNAVNEDGYVFIANPTGFENLLTDSVNDKFMYPKKSLTLVGSDSYDPDNHDLRLRWSIYGQDRDTPRLDIKKPEDLFKAPNDKATYLELGKVYEAINPYRGMKGASEKTLEMEFARAEDKKRVCFQLDVRDTLGARDVTILCVDLVPLKPAS